MTDRTSPELIHAARAPLRGISHTVGKLLHGRDKSLVRRFQQDAAPYVGELNAGELATYAVHAGAAVIPNHAETLDVLGGWLRLGGGNSAPVARLDVHRSAISEQREHTFTHVTLASPPYGGHADGRFGLQILVKTLEGEPYQGIIKPVYTQTHHAGRAANEHGVTQTMFYLDAPGSPHEGQMEPAYAAGLAAITLVNAAVELMDGVRAVAGVESSRLRHQPPIA
jgi:hypothetical protein